MTKTYRVEVTHTYLIDIPANSPDEAEDRIDDYVVATDPTSYKVKVHGPGSWDD